MKKGRLSSVGFSIGFVSSGVSALSRAHLSMAPSAAVMSWWEAAPVAQFSSGPSCGQGRGGACRSKRLIGGQHVPDRLGEAAGDVDGGDLGAALLAVAGVDALADGAVERVAEGGVRCFDQRPAQVVGSVFAQRAAPVASARLLDAWAEAGVAGELAGRREAVDVADLGGDREGEDPADPGAGQQQRDVSVVGAERSQLALAAVDLLGEGVDQGERGGQRRGPRLWQLQPLEQPAAAGAEEVAARVGHAVLEEDRVDAVFERALCLTRCSRKRARSRSALIVASGSQISGTRSSRASSASTQVSIVSVLQASGAIPRAFAASAILTSQPASSSSSWTKRAPLIDSITASTRSPASPSRWTSFASPSRSGGTAPMPTRPPSRSSACQSRRLRLRSNPTYNIAGASLRLVQDARSFAPREALLHRIQSARYAHSGVSG